MRQAVAVDLVAVAQTRLHDPLAASDFVDQAPDVRHEIVDDTDDVLGHDRTEQQSAEARRRLDRQHHVTERDPPGRHRRTGVEDSSSASSTPAAVRRTDGRPYAARPAAAAYRLGAVFDAATTAWARATITDHGRPRDRTAGTPARGWERAPAACRGRGHRARRG